MTQLQIIFLSALQGFTEFLPVSSSGHLILFSKFTAFPDQGLEMDIAVHVGSILAVAIYFYRDIWEMLCGLLNAIFSRFSRVREYYLRHASDKMKNFIFTLLLLALVTLYLLYRRRIRWNDMFYALLLPLGLSLLFVVYLWQNDILAVWYHSNFTFNLHIPELFAGRRIGMIWPELRLLLAGAGLAVVFCWRGSNLYFKILTLLFIAELAQRLLYFSAFAYYFYQLIYTAAVLSAVFLREKIFRKYFALIYVLLAALGFCMYKPAVYEGNIGSRVGRFYEPLNKKILRYITPCDYVLNGDGTLYNLYNRDPHYYWNLLGQLDVIGARVGIRPLMDINKVIRTYKPRIIFAAPYRDKYAAERGVDIYVHRPDMELVNKYYKPFDNSESLYILKPEYSKLKCEYDYKKRFYRAYD